MQGMSKDNTPIIPNPTKKVKPFCKKNCTEIFRLFVRLCRCRFLPRLWSVSGYLYKRKGHGVRVLKKQIWQWFRTEINFQKYVDL